jgi:tetratricopeptide (TPR) repeat protein
MKNLGLVAAGLTLAMTAAAGHGSPTELARQIHQAEARVDSALAEAEQQGRLEDALGHYEGVVADLERLEIDSDSPEYREHQRVLAYTYLRVGNALRQLGRKEEALQAGEKELECARNSGDDIALARTLMNFGATLLASGQVEKGLDSVEQSRPLFEQGETYDHKQGLGWYWILRTELALAGLDEAKPESLLGLADTALAILEPIENWAGVARAYELRARVHESQGRADAASADRSRAAEYKARVGEKREE